MLNLNPSEVAKALVVRLRAIQALRAETIASADLDVDQKLNAALRLSDARTNLVEFASEALKEGPRTPGTVDADTTEIPPEDDDEGEEDDPANPAAADVGGGKRARPRTKKTMPAAAQPGAGKTTQSAAPARLLQRYDALIESVEALNEDLGTEHALRTLTAAKRSIRDNKALDAEVKLHEWALKDDAHERLQEAARRRKKSAPDRSKAVPKHAGDTELPRGTPTTPATTAGAEARLARHGRVLG